MGENDSPATCAKVVKELLKLLSSDKFVIVIVRMIFGRVAMVIMVKM